MDFPEAVTTGPKRIHARQVLDALAEAGIIRIDDFVRRVVIDLDINSAAKIYVERFGDDRLLNVALTGGLVIEPAERPAEEQRDAP